MPDRTNEPITPGVDPTRQDTPVMEYGEHLRRARESFRKKYRITEAKEDDQATDTGKPMGGPPC